MRLWHQYQKQNNADTKLRASYLSGLYGGLNSKLSNNAKIAVREKIDSMKREFGEEKAKQAEQNYSLAIVSDKEKLEKAMNEFFPEIRSAKRRRAVETRADVVRQGYEQGMKININRSISGCSKKQLT